MILALIYTSALNFRLPAIFFFFVSALPPPYPSLLLSVKCGAVES